MGLEPTTLRLSDHPALGGGPGLLTHSNSTVFSACDSQESSDKSCSPGDENPHSSCPCCRNGDCTGFVVQVSDSVVVPAHSEVVFPGHVRTSNAQACPKEVGSFLPSPQLQVRLGLIAASTLSQPSSSGSVPVRLLNPSWEDITVPRRTCLGRWAHLPEQTVITNGESNANEPSPTQTPDVPDLFDWSEFSGSDEEKEQLKALLVEFSDVVATSNEDVGQTNLMAHKIDVDGAAPVKQPPRRMPFHKREEVRKHLDQMLEADVVEPSSSPWSSPVVLVKKPDGSSRFCIDYRALNNVTKKDAYPLPRIDDTLDSLGGAKYFSTLDLQSGYWQVDVDSQSRDKTAFSTPFGLYQFKRMPFGLTNAPATFQRLMAVVLRGLTPMMCLVYLDDIIVFSTTFQEHVERLRLVLGRLREAGLKLKPRKCKLLCEHVRFLGHVVSVQGVSTDPEKIRAIVDWPTPTCVKDVRSFLGMAGYYRRFIRDFSTVARPMNKLLEKDVPFAWKEDADRSFQVLKKALSSAPILSFPDFSLPFLVDTDASNSGLGAVLSQVGSDNVERPVYFASRTLNRAERKYSTTRKELLAVVWALKTFRPYLLGAPFVLRTDHNALVWLMNFKEPEGQVARWLETLAEYDFKIKHRSGKTHQNVDALSHREESSPTPECRNKLLACSSLHIAADEAQLEETRNAYSADVDLSVVVDRLSSGKHGCVPGSLMSQVNSSKLENRLLYRSFVPVNPDSQVVWQLVDPKQQCASLFSEANAGATSGHFGRKRTSEKLRMFRKTFCRRMVLILRCMSSETKSSSAVINPRSIRSSQQLTRLRR